MTNNKGRNSASHKNGHVVRDYDASENGIKMNELKVEHFMTKSPVIAHSNVNFPGGVDIMTAKGIGNLVVIENGKPIGILTEREILRYLSSSGKIPTDKLLRDIELQPFCKVNPRCTVLEAAKKMITEKCRILIFNGRSDSEDKLDRGNGDYEFVGIITASDMVRAFGKQTEKDPSLESVISKTIEYVDINDSIYRAINIMYDRNIGSVIVVEDIKEDTSVVEVDKRKRKLHGIFTERDLLTKVLSKDVSLNERVKDYCSTEMLTADMGVSATVAANIMLISKIKRLPLVTGMAADTSQTEESLTSLGIVIQKDDKHKLSAIVTARDLVDSFQSN